MFFAFIMHSRGFISHFASHKELYFAFRISHYHKELHFTFRLHTRAVFRIFHAHKFSSRFANTQGASLAFRMPIKKLDFSFCLLCRSFISHCVFRQAASFRIFSFRLHLRSFVLYFVCTQGVSYRMYSKMKLFVGLRNAK